jgi:hypothetical protein
MYPISFPELSQVLSEQTSDSSAFLNAMCLYVFNCEQHFSFFDPINCNRIRESLQYVFLHLGMFP